VPNSKYIFKDQKYAKKKKKKYTMIGFLKNNLRLMMIEG
jgi:hypothetical protein